MKGNAGTPSNRTRAALGANALRRFAEAVGAVDDLRSEPETVLTDLLADLMHWCRPRRRNYGTGTIVFESALSLARRHYLLERPRKRARQPRRRQPSRKR
jgi:hypothetical protein